MNKITDFFQNKFPLIILFMIAALIGLKSLREPDIYWMLRTGEWMIENWSVVKADPFSYTQLGNEWINVKWLFEVIIYLISVIGGAELVPVFQVFVNIVLLGFWLFLLKKLFAENFELPIFLFIALLSFVLMDFRMTGRPETISHLFSAFSIGFMLLHRKDLNFKWLWMLVPLQILWTNMHEAYGTGIVLYIIFLLGITLNSFMDGKRNLLMLLPGKKYWFVLVAIILSLAVSPRGFYMIYHPYEIFTQLGDNKFTLELYNFQTTFYWQQTETYLFFGLLATALAALLRLYILKNKKQKFHFIGVESLLWTVAFAYLALSAHRNIAFFPVIGIILLYLALYLLLQKLPHLKKILHYSMLILLPTFYLLLGSNTYYKLLEKRDAIGLREFPNKNPHDLSVYLAENQLADKKIFSDYFISNYLLWHNRPEFQSYIDLRDLDVFPVAFFNEFLLVTQVPSYFEKLHERENFELVALYSAQFAPLHRYLYQSPAWDLVFADAVGSLYVNKESGLRLQAIGKENDFEFGKCTSKPPSAAAKVLSSIVNPFFGYADDAGNHLLQASYFLNMVQDYEQSLVFAQRAAENEDLKYESLINLGNTWQNLMSVATDEQLRSEYFNNAFNAFSVAIKEDKGRKEGYNSLGRLYFISGNYGFAQNQFKKALQIDKKDLSSLTSLADCQNGLMMQNPNQQAKYIAAWFEYMELAHKYYPDNLLINYRLGVSYCDRNNCDEAASLLKGLRRLPEMTDDDYRKLLACQKKCL